MLVVILLENYSWKVVLDEDIMHGHLREPLIKVLSFFHSLGLSSDMPFHISTIMGLEGTIVQGSFKNCNDRHH